MLFILFFCVKYKVKKDDPPLELPSFPHIPSISEAWDSVTKSASSLVSGEEPLKQVITSETNETSQVVDNIIEADALDLVSKVHESSSESCHCPVGSCLGQHEDISDSN